MCPSPPWWPGSVVQCDEAVSTSDLVTTQENGNVIEDTAVKVVMFPGPSPWPYPGGSLLGPFGVPFHRSGTWRF